MVDLPAAIYQSNIVSGLGVVTVDGTVAASTVFVLIDGGTAQATTTCTASAAAWKRPNPEVEIGGSGDPASALACGYW